MARKEKKNAASSVKKNLLKDIEQKITESVQVFHKTISEKKFRKKIEGYVLQSEKRLEKITVPEMDSEEYPFFPFRRSFDCALHCQWTLCR